MEHSIADKALDMAMECGAAASRVTLTRNTENSVVVLDRHIDKVMSAGGASLSIQIFKDGRYGSFSTNMMQVERLRTFISEAMRSTSLLTEDSFRKLPDKSLYYIGDAPDLGQWDPMIQTMSPAMRVERAMKANTEALDICPDRIISLESEYGDLTDYTYITDSQGFCGETLQSSFTISTQCSVKGKGDEKPEGWWYDSSMFLDKLQYSGCGASAVQRALDASGSTRVKSGRYNIVVQNINASRLLAPILSALSGSNIQQGNSFLAHKMGQQVFSRRFTLLDTPHSRGHLGSRWFDCDGVATRGDIIIKEGCVNKFFLNSYYAAKLGMETTADSASVLKFVLEGSIGEKELSLRDVMKALGRGILVTDFNGGNCNSATGDFSYGVKGFLFEDGERVCPVSELNITGNIAELWSNLLYVCSDPWKSSRWEVPTLAFEDVNVSGI